MTISNSPNDTHRRRDLVTFGRADAPQHKAGAVSGQCDLCFQSPCNCAALLKIAREAGIPATEALPGLKKNRSGDDATPVNHVPTLPSSEAQAAAYHTVGLTTPLGRIGSPAVESEHPLLDPSVVASHARTKA